MQKIKSKPGLPNFFKTCPAPVRSYFAHLPQLVEQFPLDVPLAYVFSQLEAAQVMALYCGVTKLHSAEKHIAWKAINAHHLTRGEFRAKFEAIYGKPIPETVIRLATVAEAVRDQVMQGKNATDDNKRNAIAHALQSAIEINGLCVALGGPRPVGDLRGYKGAGKPLPKSTSRWVLRDIGFPA